MDMGFDIQENEFTPSLAGDVHIHELMGVTADRNASDMHLKAGSSPMLRVNGELMECNEYDPLSPGDVKRLFEQITTGPQRERLAQHRELDLSYSLSGVGRFRVNVGNQRGTLAIVMRRLSSQIPEIDDLNLPKICKELVMEPRGLILVTGPTGSGRSTTLAAMINHLNAREARRIITIEDPIEYLFRDKRCFITQRELGDDTLSFSEGLRHALRQDPDVILVGELRDLETVSAAITTAETGHLVLSTMHTSGSAVTLDRIVDMFPATQQQQVRTQLASIIVGVLSQALLPTADGRGRVAAVEVMTASPAIRAMIREGKSHQIPDLIESSQRMGMQTLDQALLSLYERGLVTLDEILLKAQNRDYLRSRLQGL
jgi:twitching motility protein PilT